MGCRGTWPMEEKPGRSRAPTAGRFISKSQDFVMHLRKDAQSRGYPRTIRGVGVPASFRLVPCAERGFRLDQPQESCHSEGGEEHEALASEKRFSDFLAGMWHPTTAVRTVFPVVGVCLLVFFWGLGQMPFYTRGEPREAVVVWEIANNGEWILPLRDGTEIPSKPPLFHWLGALVSTALGRVDEFTVRFPSALLGLCGVLLTYEAGKRFWGAEAGRTAALVLATNFEWWRTAVAARVDMTLTFFLVAAFLWFLTL